MTAYLCLYVDLRPATALAVCNTDRSGRAEFTAHPTTGFDQLDPYLSYCWTGVVEKLLWTRLNVVQPLLRREPVSSNSIAD